MVRPVSKGPTTIYYVKKITKITVCDAVLSDSFQSIIVPKANFI